MKWIWWSGLLALLTLVVVSCVDERSVIGSDIIVNEDVSVVSIDTTTIAMHVSRYDSLVTGTAERLLAGSHYQQPAGWLHANTLLQPVISDFPELSTTGYEYLYCRLVLFFDGYSFGDTTQQLGFSVAKVLTIDPDLGSIYNSTPVIGDAEPLGEVSFYPFINRYDSVAIPVSDDLGRQLYEFVKSDALEISDNRHFQNFLKGLLVKCSSGNAIIGIKPRAELRVYYRNRNKVPASEEYLTFAADRSLGGKSGSIVFLSDGDTDLVGIESLKTMVDVTALGGSGVIQGGSGLITRVSFPHLRNYLSLEDHLLLKAILRIEVERISGEPLPANLLVYPVNRKGTTNSNGEVAVLVTDDDLSRNPRYELEVSGFIKRILNQDFVDADDILYLQYTLTEDPGSVANTLLLKNTTKRKTKLTLYYGTVDQ